MALCELDIMNSIRECSINVSNFLQFFGNRSTYMDPASAPRVTLQSYQENVIALPM